MSEFISEFKKNIFNITKSTFENEALCLFHYQREHCTVYKNFLNNLSIDVENISSINQIPYLPIEFFKSKKVTSSINKVEIVFESSGTTGDNTSKHLMLDLNFYNKITRKGYEQFYGDLSDYVVLALLPSYLERNNSSLVFMVQEFIKLSENEDSGFYLDDLNSLKSKLKKYVNTSQKVLLIGVSFALLDLAEDIDFQLSENILVMETGGMKGRRKEMVRDELHAELKNGFGSRKIYSEYGMTELLSQAYMLDDGLFHSPDWLKVFAREIDDPFSIKQNGRGVANVIDLANIESCAFLALQDLVQLNDDSTFQVLGRVDYSDVRGCNLMYL